ncbi:hypothetical protein V6N13_033221 [Hibiscus sabdariffa]|uniref:Amino acid transporter transmembrane domain-containing protein n=1 Tax=Hibiscus sabdariffa TaxID=183260 RepID=A0ABR2FB59_9ROSI
MNAVHPIRSELSRPSDMRYAVRISLAIYFSIGFFRYMLFGDSVVADILENFDHNSDSTIGRLINDTVRLSYTMHLALDNSRFVIRDSYMRTACRYVRNRHSHTEYCV